LNNVAIACAIDDANEMKYSY